MQGKKKKKEFWIIVFIEDVTNISTADRSVIRSPLDHCVLLLNTHNTHTHIYKTENIWINLLIPLKSGKPIKLVQRFCAHHVQNMGTECKSVGGIFLKDDHHFETTI